MFLVDEEQPVASSSRVTLDDLPPAVSSPPTWTGAAEVETPAVGVKHVSSPQSPDSKGKRKEVSDEGSAQDDDGSGTEDEDDHGQYELERQRRIRENQLLIDSLGLKPTSTPRTSSFSMSTPIQSSAKRKKREGHKEVFDRSGYIVSLPAPGKQRQRMACVEMPADRQLRKRIAEGEYVDCEHWWEGEERRWRFGRGHGDNEEGEEEDLGGVTKDFRWRKWRGLEKELRAEMKQRGEMNSRDKAGAQQVTSGPSEPTPYSMIPGDPCHQCRRKSDKPKMKCRNINPACRAVFCETCCKRYSYFDFDEDSRSFICPLCKDCCNCANCIRKRDLHHLLGPGRVGAKSKDQLESGMTVQAWLENATQEKRGVPFERVRLVDQATDIISPDLPPETPPVTAKSFRPRKRKTKEPKEPKAKKAKTLRKQDEVEEGKPIGDDKENVSVTKIKLKVPRKPARIKEVDSEGDTVGGYSDDDDAASDASSKLTSLSDDKSRSSTDSPRPDFATNDYLASLVGNDTEGEGTITIRKDVPTLAVAMSQTTDATDDRIRRPQVTSISSQDSVTDSGKKRRKPPPKANILRAPKYTIQDESASGEPEAPVTSRTEPETPLTADDQQTWQESRTSMQFQSFSYEGYSTLPPVSELSPVPAMMPHMTSINTMIHGYPPPYSHSPPSRQAPLDVHVAPAYASKPVTQNMTSTHSNVFAGTGHPNLPTSHPSAAGSINPQGVNLGYSPKAGFIGPMEMQRLAAADGEVSVGRREGFWQEQTTLGMVHLRPTDAPEMGNGLMLNRQYYPSHP